MLQSFMYYTLLTRAGKRHRYALPLGLLLCVSLTGCGGGGGGSSVVGTVPVQPLPPAPTPIPIPLVTTVSASALQNFTVSLAEDSAVVPVGGTVNYTLTLTNTSSSTATVIVAVDNGQTVPIAVLRVTNPNGTTVYPVARPGVAHDNAPPAPPPLDVPATLAPGQSLTTIHRAVSAFASAGTYQAVATFTVASTAADTKQMVTLPSLGVTAR